VKVIKGRTSTGRKDIDNAILSAYGRSLFLFFLPPLIANQMITDKEQKLWWTRMIKLVSDIPKGHNNQQVFNMTDEGPKCAVTQANDIARKLKKSMNKTKNFRVRKTVL
jgi:hypothetical protein